MHKVRTRVEDGAKAFDWRGGLDEEGRHACKPSLDLQPFDVPALTIHN